MACSTIENVRNACALHCAGQELDKLKAKSMAYDESHPESQEGDAAPKAVQGDRVTKGVGATLEGGTLAPLDEEDEDEENVYFDGAEGGDVDEDPDNAQDWS